MQNRLADASSPYLRMHAGNPVAWQPWDDAALAEARAADRPILLSIGYSACHWCHVMAHECFEDPDIAAVMNAAFVNIKLDREERPDIDQVYQLAHQALTGRGGGWPLTVFLDPTTLAPFYIGTYFPPQPRHGLPGFGALLERLAAQFRDHRQELPALAEMLDDWIGRLDGRGHSPRPAANSASAKALQRVEARFDHRHGGSLGAPKFPQAAELEWLLDRGGHAEARHMAEKTLDNMATRGLQDHLGGGFFRYCVDPTWSIPHFEKMLYVNAQLLPVYARLAADGQAEPRLQQTARSAVDGILDWLQHGMTADDGTFYSALGADSEGEEGRFYLWTREQVRAALPDSAWTVAVSAFGLDHPPNYEGHAWHLLRAVPLHDLTQQLDRPADALHSDLEGATRTLFQLREQREHPLRDDKILTAWNALAISGLARAARLLDEPRCRAMAERALAGLRASVWSGGRLFANAATAAQRIPAFLDDHAFALDALLESLQLRFHRQDLDWAMALADALCQQFQHPDGGFRFSTATHATPLAPARNWIDEALPNGNGVAIRSLLRLGHLLGDTRYLQAAERALDAASDMLANHPEACPTALRALHEADHPRTQIVIRTPEACADVWRAALHAADASSPADASDGFLIPDEHSDLPGVLGERTARGTNGTAWVCRGTTCLAPVTAPAELLRACTT